MFDCTRVIYIKPLAHNALSQVSKQGNGHWGIQTIIQSDSCTDKGQMVPPDKGIKILDIYSAALLDMPM